MPKIFVFIKTSDFEIESSTCVSAAKLINLSGLNIRVLRFFYYLEYLIF